MLPAKATTARSLRASTSRSSAETVVPSSTVVVAVLLAVLAVAVPANPKFVADAPASANAPVSPSAIVLTTTLPGVVTTTPSATVAFAVFVFVSTRTLTPTALPSLFAVVAKSCGSLDFVALLFPNTDRIELIPATSIDSYDASPSTARLGRGGVQAAAPRVSRSIGRGSD